MGPSILDAVMPLVNIPISYVTLDPLAVPEEGVRGSNAISNAKVRMAIPSTVDIATLVV
jgi:hypothetical protein